MVKSFRTFIGKKMINDFVTASAFGMENVYRIIYAYRIGSCF